MNEPKRLPGRTRTHDVHPSWADYVAHFDPTNPYRSQGAFCRWAGIRPSSLSAAKRKQIHIAMEEAISIWIEGLQKLETNIPDWWAGYKERNPDDKDEYDPRKHCCAKFWKDWCNCMKK